MDEEITDRLQTFILREEEKDTVEMESHDIKTSLQDCEVSLLGMVISDKEVGFQGVKNTMPWVWGNPVGLKIKKVEKNFFRFIFKNKASVNKVLFGVPWLFDIYLLNLHAWEPKLKSGSPAFNICELWVQVWSIPLHWMSEEVGGKIGHALGGMTCIIIPENGTSEGRHLRLKVLMNINKPLPRGKLIKLRYETKWVELRYENLPSVCFYCGMLGHNEKNCFSREEDVRFGKVKNDQFGAWIRAENHASFFEPTRRYGKNGEFEGAVQRNINVITRNGGENSGRTIQNALEGMGSSETQPRHGMEGINEAGNKLSQGGKNLLLSQNLPIFWKIACAVTDSRFSPSEFRVQHMKK